jgi:hypothetical protein
MSAAMLFGRCLSPCLNFGRNDKGKCDLGLLSEDIFGHADSTAMPLAFKRIVAAEQKHEQMLQRIEADETRSLLSGCAGDANALSFFTMAQVEVYMLDM